MLPTQRSVCALCRFTWAINGLGSPALAPLVPIRSMSRRRSPARMTLSPRVGSPAGKASSVAQPKSKTRNSPFGGMNLTSAHMTRKPGKRSEAATKRSRRLFPGSKDEKKEDRREPYHALKMQQALSTVSYGQRNATKSRIADIDSFDQFALLPVVKEAIDTQALPHMEEKTPTPIQRLAIPSLTGNEPRRKTKLQAGEKRNFEQFLLAAETGSGKTLAYVLPILDAIKRAEAIEDQEEASRREETAERSLADPNFIEPPALDDRQHPTSGRPRAIVLVPSSELVTQVWSVIRSLSFKVKIRSDGIHASVSPQVIRRRVFGPGGIDILVATPHLLFEMSKADPQVLSRVRHLVIDEADSLLDRSFRTATTPIIDRSIPSLHQLVFCSATIPRSLDTFLREHFPDLKRLVTPSLHTIPRRVQLGVVDIDRLPYQGRRDLACADTIMSISKAAGGTSHGPDEHQDPFALKRVLVFVNEREKTTELADYLKSKGIDATPLNRDTSETRKSEILADFTTQPTRPDDVPSPSGNAQRGVVGYKTADKYVLDNVKVLVTTDLASRGIDTLSVRNVVLYDVPHSTIDFIHRLGRTGRMGRRGRGVVLVGKRDRKDIVREVREGMYRGQALI